MSVSPYFVWLPPSVRLNAGRIVEKRLFCMNDECLCIPCNIKLWILIAWSKLGSETMAVSRAKPDLGVFIPEEIERGEVRRSQQKRGRRDIDGILWTSLRSHSIWSVSIVGNPGGIDGQTGPALSWIPLTMSFIFLDGQWPGGESWNLVSDFL